MSPNHRGVLNKQLARHCHWALRDKGQHGRGGGSWKRVTRQLQAFGCFHCHVVTEANCVKSWQGHHMSDFLVGQGRLFHEYG